jgi:DNA-binding NtrC family response regulator
VLPFMTGPKVLLVDDEGAIRDVISVILTRAGFEVVQAGTAEEALALLGRHELAAALIDKSLHRMDGLDLIRHLKRRQPYCACLLMTGFPSVGSAVEALRLGVADYLAKPSPELDQVAQRVQAAIAAVWTIEDRQLLFEQVRLLEQELKRKEELLQLREEELHLRNAELVKLRIQLDLNEELSRDRPGLLG